MNQALSSTKSWSDIKTDKDIDEYLEYLVANNKKYDTIIDASNSHVYPGIIALNTNLGLVEVDAVRASVDDDETGTYLPEIRSIIAYNAESKAVESMRPNGVLLAQIAPNGGIISGKSSVVQFDAWNWEDAVIKYDQGIHLNWPSPYTFGRWWLGEDRGLKANNNYSKQIKDLKNFFEKSKAGSIAFFVSAFIVMLSCGIFYDVGLWFYILGSFAVFVVTMFEARPSFINIDDNLAIPVGFCLVMTLFDIILNYQSHSWLTY